MKFICSQIMDVRLKHPFGALIAGPSACGKTIFTSRLIKFRNEMVDVPFGEIIWCYSEWQQFYDTLKEEGVIFHEGMPDLKTIPQRPTATLLILDDLMQEANGSIVVDLFSRVSHHRNISVIHITQNVFHQGKGARDISLNTHYIVYFKNPRDGSQIFSLARQIYPKNPKFLQEAYEDATQKPHGYLLIDLKQSTPDTLRYRTEIFPDDEVQCFYQPRK